MAQAAEQSQARQRRRRVIGIVTAAQRTPKTLRVVSQYRVRHGKYGKYVRHRTIMHVHDEKNEARVGDRVEIAECRPLSKLKRWRLVRILDRAPQEMATAALA